MGGRGRNTNRKERSMVGVDLLAPSTIAGAWVRHNNKIQIRPIRVMCAGWPRLFDVVRDPFIPLLWGLNPKPFRFSKGHFSRLHYRSHVVFGNMYRVSALG